MSSPKSNSSTPSSKSSGDNNHMVEFVPLAPVAVAAYLQAYGFAAVDPKTWRVPPGHAGNLMSGTTVPAPTVELHVAGHKEVDGHTWYSFACSLVDGSVNTNWSAHRRLQQLREDLHDTVKAQLGDVYSQHFANTPFAKKGGLPGTTARLQSWLCTLAACINAGHAPPSVVALLLTFLDAPEWKLDAVPAQSSRKGLSSPALQPGSRGKAGGGLLGAVAAAAKPYSDNAQLEDIELSMNLDLDLDDLVLTEDFIQEPKVAEPIKVVPPVANGPEEFLVQLVKRDDGDQILGCDIVSLRYRNRGALRVEAVSGRPGLIGQWNARNPSMQVKSGHYIVEVNSESVDAEKMSALISEERVLDMRIQRRWP